MRDYTKQMLCETLKEMMRSITIQKIRVSDICKACNIERSTFYYHFKDKYDLVTYIYLQDVKDLDITDYKEAAIGLARMRENIAFYRNAYKDFPDNIFLKYLREYYYSDFLSRIEKRVDQGNVTDEVKLQLRLYLTGSTIMSMKWIMEPQRMTAFEFAREIYDAMPAKVKAVIGFKEIDNMK